MSSARQSSSSSFSGGAGALGELRGLSGIGAGGVQRPGGHALREDHVDAAARVDFDHREDFLGEADVVLGEPVQALPTPVPDRLRAALPGSTVLVVPSGETDSVVELCVKA